MYVGSGSISCRRLATLWVLAVLLIGCGLRLYGIRHDLPHHFDIDEPLFVSHAVLILNTRDLNPHWFGPPASTTIYALCAVYTCLYVGGRTLGRIRDAADFRNLFLTDPTAFYLSGRLVSALVGVATILAVWFIVHRLLGRWAGL